MRILFLVRLLALALPLFLLAGQLWGQPEKRRKSIASTSALLEKSPTSEKLRKNLVNLLFIQGMKDLEESFHREASAAFQEALMIAKEGSDPIPETAKIMRELRYGLGYSLLQEGKSLQAVEVLEELPEESDMMATEQYLFAVALVKSMTPENIERGLEMLRGLAKGRPGVPQIVGGLAAVRLGYNISTVDFAGGKDEQALMKVRGIVSDFGENPSREKMENDNLMYALGKYKVETGDMESGLADLASLNESANDFTLNSGTTLNQVRGDAYYSQALILLEGGAEEAGQALGWLEKLEQLDGGKTPEGLHAKVWAYKKMGDEEASQKALAEIRELDLDYWNNITR